MPFVRLSLTLGLLLPLSPVASARQEPPLTDTLLLDLLEGESPAFGHAGGSRPHLIASDGNRAYFWAEQPSTGGELWITDGTTEGTRLVADAIPGPSDGARPVQQGAFLPDGRLVYFSFAPGAGIEPYVSDGTAAGTRLLRDIFPGHWDSISFTGPRAVAFQDRVYFAARDGVTGRKLWATDGTPEGTKVALDLVPGADEWVQTNGVFASSQQLFVMSGVPGGNALFTWEGGPAPAKRVAELPGYAVGESGRWCFLGDSLVFSVDQRQWWISDGTTAGTTKLLHSPAQYEALGWCAVSNDRLYLMAKLTANGPYRLLVGSGAVGDLEPVQHWLPTFYPTAYVSPLDPGLAFGGGLLFSAEVPGAGLEPVFCGGSSAEAFLLADLVPGAQGSAPTSFFEHGGEAYFLAETPDRGRELWRADLAGASAVPLGELLAGPAGVELVASSFPPMPTAKGLVFAADSPAPLGIDIGVEPVLASETGVSLLADLSSGQEPNDSFPADFARLGDRLIFSASTEPLKRELWSTDGTAAGTGTLSGPNASPGFSFPGILMPFGDRLLLTASTGAEGRELWRTDGTLAGTERLTDLWPGPAGSWPDHIERLGDRAVFVANDGVHGVEPYALLSDGVTVTSLGDLWPGSKSSDVFRFTPYAGRLFFSARDPQDGRELWSTDGTPEGTALFASIQPGTADGSPSWIRASGGLLYFGATDPTTGNEPWVSDGTPSGTRVITDLTPGEAGSSVRHVTAISGGVVFTIIGPSGLRELYRTDGTQAGTVRVLDPSSSAPLGHWEPDFEGLSAAGSALLTRTFVAGQTQLWITDGTPAGTLHLDGGTGVSAPTLPRDFWMAGGGERVMFTALSPAGKELWTTDGTAAGTRQVADSATGLLSGDAAPGGQLGNQVLFNAWTPEAGAELHAIPLLATGGFGAAPLGSGCGPAGSAPELVALGEVATGAALLLGVSSAQPLAPVLHYFSQHDAGPNPVGSCAVLLEDPMLLGISAADTAGTCVLKTGFPDDSSLVGLPLYVQAASIEPGGPYLGVASLTQALELVAK